MSLAQSQGFATLWMRPGAGGMGVLPALDLVIAMPISWLPLVADYARHGTSGRAALRGTWLGYALANLWCYALGVLVALTLPSQDLVTALLLAQGGLIALSLILIDEVDNAYGDAYSGAVSAHSLVPRWGVRRWGLAVAALCTALALVLPMHSLEPFLLLLRLGVRAAVRRDPRPAGVRRAGAAGPGKGAAGGVAARRPLDRGHRLLPRAAAGAAGAGRGAADAVPVLRAGVPHPPGPSLNNACGAHGQLAWPRDGLMPESVSSAINSPAYSYYFYSTNHQP